MTRHPSTRRTARPSQSHLILLSALTVAILSGCAVTPLPITDAARSQRAQEDVQTLFQDMEPIAGEVTLHEAFARALKYNYDYRLRSMERSMASSQLDLAKYDMLPKLTASAGYSARDNDAGSRSVDLDTGVESDLFTGAQERKRSTYNALFTWNILDFGVSYVRAQQQAEQVLIAEERKRKVVQNISQDVRQAFWRAYVAQKTLPRMDALLNRLNEALVRSGRMEKEKLMPPMQALTYQRALLDLHQQVVARRQELILAKSELSALINLRPGTEYTLAAADADLQVDAMHRLDDMDALDQTALTNRPELREEDYTKKISVLEARKALLSFLPGIEFSISSNYDSNKYLLNNSWNEAGGMISMNLLRAFSYPATRRAQQTQLKLDDTRRIAVTMAVLTQVRIATLRYAEAQDEYLVSRQGAEVDARIEQHMLSGVEARSESEMDLLRTQVKSALSDMQQYVALANLQVAYARVANSVGADLLPDVPHTESVKQFTAQLASADKEWRTTNFRTTTGAPAMLEIGVAPIAAPAGSGLDLSTLLLKRLGTLAGVKASAGTAAANVSATVKLGQPVAGMRSVELIWSVRRDGATLATIPYRSVIPESVPSAWSVFGEAATESAAMKIVSALRGNPRNVAAAESN